MYEFSLWCRRQLRSQEARCSRTSLRTWRISVRICAQGARSGARRAAGCMPLSRVPAPGGPLLASPATSSPRTPASRCAECYIWARINTVCFRSRLRTSYAGGCILELFRPKTSVFLLHEGAACTVDGPTFSCFDIAWCRTSRADCFRLIRFAVCAQGMCWRRTCHECVISC